MMHDYRNIDKFEKVPSVILVVWVAKDYYPHCNANLEESYDV